jgi:hypothetical protein
MIFKQSVLPTEIIIIISEYINSNENSELIHKLKKLCKNYNIKIIIQLYTERQYAGKNRQIALTLSECDIIIYQDADDYSHKQRIEIIQNIFNTYDCVHVLHGWSGKLIDKNIHSDIKDEDYIRLVSTNHFPHKIAKKNKKICIANGPLSFKTSIIKNMGDLKDDTVWNNSKKKQDIELNKFIIDKFKNTILLDNRDIYNYRNELSSWG